MPLPLPLPLSVAVAHHPVAAPGGGGVAGAVAHHPGPGAEVTVDGPLVGSEVVLRPLEEPAEDGVDVGRQVGCDALVQVGDVALLELDTHPVGVLERGPALGQPAVVQVLDGRDAVRPGGLAGRRVDDVVALDEGTHGVEVPVLAVGDHAERAGTVVRVGQCHIEVTGHSLLLAGEAEGAGHAAGRRGGGCRRGAGGRLADGHASRQEGPDTQGCCCDSDGGAHGALLGVGSVRGCPPPMQPGVDEATPAATVKRS